MAGSIGPSTMPRKKRTAKSPLKPVTKPVRKAGISKIGIQLFFTPLEGR
jgi:hypothetical protein